MTESGQAARKLTSILNVFSSSERSLHHMWWFQLACFGGKGRLHFVDESAKVDSAYYVDRLLPSLVNDCIHCFQEVIFFSRMACQHTQLVPRRTGYKSTVQISLTKTSGLQIHQTWIPWITMFGERCWRPITSAIQNWRQSPNSRKHCRRSGTAYLKVR